jgi:hypothetical protein
MEPQEFYDKLLTYGINPVEVEEYFTYDFISICDLSYDFRAAIFDIDEGIFYDEIARAAKRSGGWLSAA